MAVPASTAARSNNKILEIEIRLLISIEIHDPAIPDSNSLVDTLCSRALGKNCVARDSRRVSRDCWAMQQHPAPNSQRQSHSRWSQRIHHVFLRITRQSGNPSDFEYGKYNTLNPSDRRENARSAPPPWRLADKVMRSTVGGG